MKIGEKTKKLFNVKNVNKMAKILNIFSLKIHKGDGI